MDFSFPIILSKGLASRQVGHEQEGSRFFPNEGKPIGGQLSFYTKDLIMSFGEAEGRDLGTGIENRKFTNWLCGEDLTVIAVRGPRMCQLLHAIVNSLAVNF